MTDRGLHRFVDLRARMVSEGVDLVVLGPGAHMQWLLGYHPHPDERPCVLLIGPERAAFLVPALNAADVRAATSVPLHSWSDADGPDAALRAALAEVGATVRCLALDETMRADFALLVQRALPNAGIVFTETTVGHLRQIKDRGEIAALQRAAGIADTAIGVAVAAISPGTREVEIVEAVRRSFAAAGAVMQFAIIGSGPNSALPHHAPGQRCIAPGDAVVVDIGGRIDGFNSDITRMAVVGAEPDLFGEVHAIVNDAVEAALAVVRPGCTAAAVDQAARSVIDDAGYGEYFVHRTGHGLGIDVHEPPYITSNSTVTLQEGMAFSIEPGIYLPNRFGVRLEEIVVLRQDGPEILSGLAREPFRC